MNEVNDKNDKNDKNDEVNDKEAIFINVCCGSGLKFLKAFVKNHPEVKIRGLSMFMCKDEGLDKKYGFELNSLNTSSYIIYEGKLIKGDN